MWKTGNRGTGRVGISKRDARSQQLFLVQKRLSCSKKEDAFGWLGRRVG